MKSAIALALAALVLSPAAALAAPGDLDPTFDGDGKRVLSFDAMPEVVLMQPDGKIVVAGTASGDFTVWRFNDDGSLDRSFGGDGTAAIDIGGGDELRAAALQPDGKIVVTGRNALAAGPAVARLTAGGKLDTTFAPGGDDGDGKRVLNDVNLAAVRAVLVRPDGRIVLAGDFNDKFALIGLKSDGRNDDAVLEPVNFGGRDYATAAALTPAGEIVVAGNTYTPPMLAPFYDVALARWTADGKLDKTLAGSGKVTFGFEGLDQPKAVLVRPDGGVLVAGFNQEGDSRTFVTRVSRTGEVDRAFAAGATDFEGPDWPVGLGLRPDGRIVVAATAGYDIAAAQLTPAGGLDPAFGAGGRATIGFGDANAANAAALQADGKLVVAGVTVQGLARKMAIARLLGDPPPATPSDGGGGLPPAVAPRCGGRLATIVGTDGRDVLRGTRRADVIVALGGADRVLARGGNDLVCGGAGDDRLSGGAGRDRLLGERGRDRLDGGRGRDRLVGGPGRDRARQ